MPLFGLSHDDRMRLDKAAESGVVALSRLEQHEVRCTERYGSMEKAIQQIQTMREVERREQRAASIRLILMLSGILVSILILIVKEYIVRGIAHS